MCVAEGNFNIFLYDGYDWVKTRKVIEEEVKEVRRRLAKIRQLVANGQVEDPSLEDTSTLLYNSIHIGLDDDEDALGEPAALLAAIDRELKEDFETTSWQSLPTFHGGGTTSKPRTPSIKVHGKRLTRSRGPSIEFSLHGLRADFDKFHDDGPLVSRTLVTVRDVEILDHIKTSTWKKFLMPLRSDSKGNVRETDSDMVKIELKSVKPVLDSSEEARLKVSFNIYNMSIALNLVFRPRSCQFGYMLTRMLLTFSRSFSASKTPMLYLRMVLSLQRHTFVSLAEDYYFGFY